MDLPTPLTSQQVDGAVNTGEVPVLFLTGPHQGMHLLVDSLDSKLPSALVHQAILWVGLPLSDLGVIPAPMVITLENGDPIPDPPVAYPMNLRFTMTGPFPSGQNFALLGIDNVFNTVPVTEGGAPGAVTYSAVWTAERPGQHIVEMLLATGSLAASSFTLSPVETP